VKAVALATQASDQGEGRGAKKEKNREKRKHIISASKSGRSVTDKFELCFILIFNIFFLSTTLRPGQTTWGARLGREEGRGHPGALCC
jgi:hypothetical protein